MPARTNHFQRVVSAICKRCEEDGIEITDSGFVTEPSGSKREVDVKIEGKLCGMPIVIAVEARDRKRKADVEWIDQLIGKYSGTSTKVHHTVAVSKSGFTKTAAEKAAANGITAVSMQQLDSDYWPSHFHCLRVALSSTRMTPVAFSVAPKIEVSLSESLLFRDDEAIGALQDVVVELLVPKARERVLNQLSNNVAEFFPNMAAVKNAILRTEHDFPCRGLNIQGPNHGTHQITSILVVLDTKMNVTDVENSFSTPSSSKFEPLTNVCITSVTLDEVGIPLDVSLIQSADAQTMHVCMTPLKN